MALAGVVKAVVVLGAVSLAGLDAGSIGVCRLSGADLAAAAASAAGAAWGQTHDPQQAYDAALRRVHDTDPGASLPRDAFAVAPDGAVRLVVRRTARTYVVARVGAVRGWALVEAPGAAPASP